MSSINKDHCIAQSANDWLICKCGKLFADSRKGNITKFQKHEKHLRTIKLNKLKEELFPDASPTR